MESYLFGEIKQVFKNICIHFLQLLIKCTRRSRIRELSLLTHIAENEANFVQIRVFSLSLAKIKVRCNVESGLVKYLNLCFYTCTA